MRRSSRISELVGLSQRLMLHVTVNPGPRSSSKRPANIVSKQVRIEECRGFLTGQSFAFYSGFRWPSEPALGRRPATLETEGQVRTRRWT